MEEGNADTTDHDSDAEGIEIREEARERHAAACQADAKEHAVRTVLLICHVSENRLDDGSGKVRGHDEESRGGVIIMVCSDEERKYRCQCALIDIRAHVAEGEDVTCPGLLF